MYRGSSSEHASSYKKAGHVNEKDFGAIVGGTNKGLPNTGKTDWVDVQGRTYSVKRGFGCKKWQIFLYRRERIENDAGFNEINGLGILLLQAIDSFPEDYSLYAQDKRKVKNYLRRIVTEEDSGFTLFTKTREEFTGKNSYLDSKVKLAKVTSEIAKVLSKADNLAAFIRKSMFNSEEVGHLAISTETAFDVYSQETTVKVLCDALQVGTSGAGTNRSDLNVAGQKVIMKSTQNVVELEIRNDSAQHYRELRFNMVAQPAISILQDGTYRLPDTTFPGIEWRGLRPK